GCCGAGDPVNVGTGNEYEDQQDYSGPGPLKLDRYYDSDTSTVSSHIGAHWRHTFDRSIKYVNSPPTATIFRQDGRQIQFRKSSGVWIADPDINDTLFENDDGQGHILGWSYFV